MKKYVLERIQVLKYVWNILLLIGREKYIFKTLEADAFGIISNFGFS